MTDLQNQLNAKTSELDQQLRMRQERVLFVSGCRSIPSLHGIIGSKNNEFVDVVRQRFMAPQQFIAEWESGALQKAKTERQARGYRKYQYTHEPAIFRLIRLLKHEDIREYTHLFLERNFYRQFHARIREKPNENLWEVWFGSNPLVWGLLIAPRFSERNAIWENDVSAIRRVKFRYWTLGHVLESGIVTPDSQQVMRFNDLDSFFAFYQQTVVRATGSRYATEMACLYERFARQSSDPTNVPLMIPEFRFSGRDVRHKYRLDFTVLSVERGLRVGIELSPWSTHGVVKGKIRLKELGGENAIEQQRLALWEREMEKRNDYFAGLGISILTYSDSRLRDMESVFTDIRGYLEPSVTSATLLNTGREIGEFRLD